MNRRNTLLEGARRIGLRRSVLGYLAILFALVLAGELIVEQFIGEGGETGSPFLNALVLAALVGVFVFFVFKRAFAERDRAGRALAESEDRFRSLTALSADWFWETDTDHRLVWLAGGQSMLQLFGSSLAYGQRPWEVGGLLLAPETLAAHRKAIEAREPFRDLELCRPGGEGECLAHHECIQFHLISGEPRHDSEGRFIGYRGVGRDVTEKVNSGRALSMANERLEMALDAGSLAIWESDVTAGKLSLGDGWARIIGSYPGSRRASTSEVVERVHEHDREAVLLASKRAIKGETPLFAAELRVRTDSGDWKWVSTTGLVVQRDKSGRALRMTGTAIDIDRRKRAENASNEAEARYRTLIDLSPDAILLQSDGRIEYANRAAAQMLGTGTPSALIGRETISLVHPEDRSMVLERARYLREGPGKSDFRERRVLRADGNVIVAEGASVSYLERGRLVVQTVLRDISEKVRAREELAERERRFRDVVEAAGEYVWETDLDFRYVWLSGRVEAVLGYRDAELIGRRPHDFMPLGEDQAVGERLERHRERAEGFRELVHRSITKSGRPIWQSVSGVPVYDADGRLKGYRGTGADITAKRHAEERIQFLATRDALTGLPNRVLLADRAGQVLVNAGRNSTRLAILSLKLDRFSVVTESLGHDVGDAVLRVAADRMGRTLRRDDTLGRLGADEFVLLWDGSKAVEDVALVAQKLLNCFAPPIVVEDRSLNLTASIGISVFPDDGGDFVELLKNAAAARQVSSAAQGNTYRFSSRELNARVLERLEMENDLYRALAREEFVLLFHPMLAMGSGRVVGAEVLLSWRHPVRGLLPAERFLPFAEQCGLGGDLRRLLVTLALAQIAKWQDGPLAGLAFSINMAPREFSREPRFAETLGRALAAHGVDASRLSLELDARGMNGEGEDPLDALRQAAGLGVGLTIDGFGNGPLNVLALRDLQVKKLKIDRGFVERLGAGDEGAVVVQTFAAMARGLGLAFAAEGVDTPAQLEKLRVLGCDEWQGGLFSDPLDAAGFERLLAPGARAASA